MELFLNLLWVLIAVGAVGVWRISWLPQDARNRRDPLREWTAMCCSLILLFFAVSLTDDLNSDVMLLEGLSTGRRQSMDSHHSQHSTRVVHESGPAALPPIVMLAPVRLSCGISPAAFRLPPRASCRRFCGRAPPIATL